ncbi:MAG: PDZ domain-containing protein [Lachnospiraceae bacterium]|nr:PDZ domain-containing protein [Lachnospiraceae bacterium]MDY5701415.1 PDZ domain-containing protein [Lachnospiraceae bacterium]
MKILEEKRDFEFMTERVKERPLNKRKLLRKTIITVTMAVIFGLIACVTFLVLEPVFSNWLYPGEEIEMIEIPQDTDEVLPEDMLVHEESMLEQTEQVINSLKNEMQLNPSSYQELYSSIYALTQELNAAMVTVTSVSQDIDWFNDPYENKGQTTGFLFADNNRELMILVMSRELTVGEELKVTFANGDQATAAIKGTDTETGLTVLAVEKDALVETTTESIQFINLGRSAGARLTASPVVAIGRPLGKQNSVVFGMITSEDTVLSLTDANYKLLTTDIYGSTDATGLLINMDGQVIGVINQSYNNKTAANLISAIGITELKLVLQRMSNGFENSYLGIKGTDVPEEIAVSLKVPQGAYVTGIVMDSPAMAAGIQSGDVIVQMGKLEIRSFKDYTEAVRQKNPGEVVEMVVMRQGQQTYRMVNLEVTMGKLEY